ncbi:MAG TPA: helix-turn-helix domain-containing protein [Rhizomicrobium sp.]|jgi:AcrR family transcriptional regulator|nr:helix-turn-helix domain-containing protein [Rhizomicrobium sp.]
MDVKPSQGSRRELTKTQNRETILEAARVVFAQLGYANATVRDIIRATPLASGTFYNYFKSKEQVHQALRDEEALILRPRLARARAEARTAEEFIAASFRAFFWFEADKGEAGSERFRLDSPEVLAGFAELRQDIERAMARGLMPPADVGLLTAALAGVAFELAEEVKRGAEVEKVTQFATALFLNGIGGLPSV